MAQFLSQRPWRMPSSDDSRRNAHPTMTHPLATRMAALLNLTGRLSLPAAPGPDAARITLATLNQARKTLPHPATPAYRLRQPARHPLGRPAWPFPVDASCSTTPGAKAGRHGGDGQLLP